MVIAIRSGKPLAIPELVDGCSVPADNHTIRCKRLGIVLIFNGLHKLAPSLLLQMRGLVGIKYIKRCFAGGNASPSQGLARVSCIDWGVISATRLPEQDGIP